jgi:hypothetical protein
MNHEKAGRTTDKIQAQPGSRRPPCAGRRAKEHVFFRFVTQNMEIRAWCPAEQSNITGFQRCEPPRSYHQALQWLRGIPGLSVPAIQMIRHPATLLHSFRI